MMTMVDVVPLYERILKLDSGELSFGDLNFIAETNIYLYCSYAYYELNESLMSDLMFDLLCSWLYENYDILAFMGVWWVGKTIVKDNLKAGTCLGVEYPKMVRDTATQMVRYKRGTPESDDEECSEPT